jgi:hypothetical protein
MAMFVHLTAEKNVRAIARNGISRLRKLSRYPAGIFAMPVTRNFYISHQWLRELKRRGCRSIVGVYFRIADEDMVWVGHYNQPHQSMTAAQALALIADQKTPEGYQVIVPRRIASNEIHRVRQLPQVVGWRYQPGAHGKKPCPCPICVRGSYGARRIRKKYE